MREFTKTISLWVLIGIVVILLASGLGTGLGYPKEDVQLFLLPFFILAVWFVPRNFALRIPWPLVACCMLLWFCAYSGLEGYSERHIKEPHNFVSRLDGDTTGLYARGFYQRYNEISRTYHLPFIRILNRTFKDDGEAHKWLENRNQVSFVVRSLGSWVRLVLSHSAKHLFKNHPRIDEFQELDSSQSASIRSYGLLPFDNVLPVPIGGLANPFVITFQPEAVSVPNEPSELALHLIAWVSSALQVMTEDQKVDWSAELAMRLHSSSEASDVLGDWHSSAPRGLALYLKGTFELLELFEQQVINRKQCRAVVETFYQAAAEVRIEEAPELYSAIFNNAAVTLSSCAENIAEFEKSRGWLELAIGASKVRGSRAARAALYNLNSLSQPKDF